LRKGNDYEQCRKKHTACPAEVLGGEKVNKENKLRGGRVKFLATFIKEGPGTSSQSRRGPFKEKLKRTPGAKGRPGDHLNGYETSNASAAGKNTTKSGDHRELPDSAKTPRRKISPDFLTCVGV